MSTWMVVLTPSLNNHGKMKKDFVEDLAQEDDGKFYLSTSICSMGPSLKVLKNYKYVNFFCT